MIGARARIHHAAMRIFAERGGETITISDLAREAGLSRGTIYNNLEAPARLFDSVCDLMAEEFAHSVAASFTGIDDPAQRLANAVRLCVRRVHEEPDWGRFVARYAMIEPKLGAFWGKVGAEELRRGLASGRFDFRREQTAAVAALIGGATFGAMALVIRGLRTWREAGADTAELSLRAVGLPPEEGRRIATVELEPLPRMAVFDAA